MSFQPFASPERQKYQFSRLKFPSLSFHLTKHCETIFPRLSYFSNWTEIICRKNKWENFQLNAQHKPGAVALE